MHGAMADRAEPDDSFWSDVPELESARPSPLNVLEDKIHDLVPRVQQLECFAQELSPKKLDRLTELEETVASLQHRTTMVESLADNTYRMLLMYKEAVDDMQLTLNKVGPAEDKLEELGRKFGHLEDQVQKIPQPRTPPSLTTPAPRTTPCVIDPPRDRSPRRFGHRAL